MESLNSSHVYILIIYILCKIITFSSMNKYFKLFKNVYDCIALMCCMSSLVIQLGVAGTVEYISLVFPPIIGGMFYVTVSLVMRRGISWFLRKKMHHKIHNISVYMFYNNYSLLFLKPVGF